MKRLRVGLVGLGEFGELYAKILAQLPYIELAMVCSRTESRAKEIAAKYGASSFKANPQAVAKAKDLDVLCVTNCGKDHRQIVVPALEAGMNVLVEKPIADSVEDALAMVEAARRAKGFLMVAHICRFMPQYRRAKDLISAGRLGRIALIQAFRNNHRSTLAPGKKKNPMRETAIHDIDLALWFAGGKVESAQGYRKYNNSRIEADSCLAIAKLDNGVVCSFSSSWLGRDAQPAGLDARMDVIGSLGELHIKMPPDNLTFIDDCEHSFFNPETSSGPESIRQTSLAAEIEYFLKCVLTGAKPSLITPEEALASLQATIKIDESCEEIKQ